MKLSKSIIKKLKNDVVFRLGVGSALEIGERQVMNLIEANTKNGNLTKKVVLDYFKSKNIPESEIFESEKLVKTH